MNLGQYNIDYGGIVAFILLPLAEFLILVSKALTLLDPFCQNMGQLPLCKITS